MPLPKGYTLDAQPAKLPDGYALDAPAAPRQAPDFTPGADNQEGLYKMASHDGKILQVPFSKVSAAREAGLKFWGTKDAITYQHDSAARLPLVDRMQSNFDFATRDVPSNGSESDGSRMKAALQNVGGHIGGTVGGILVHPEDTVEGLLHTAGNVLDPTRIGPPQFVKDMYHSFVDSPDKVAAGERLLGDVGGNMLLGEAGGRVMKGVSKAKRAVVRGVGNAADTMVTPKNLDVPIPGDTVTPRQQYQAAQGQGVNLDLAQATGGKFAKMLKRPVEHSLAGSSVFEESQAAQRAALNNHVEKVLDQTGPMMSRQEFGETAKQALLDHMQKLNGDAGEIFDELTSSGNSFKPDVSDVRGVARKIITENQGLYSKIPELKRGPISGAWNLVRNLAQLDEQGAPLKGPAGRVSRFTWTELHKLRSGLMDLYRSPEIVQSPAEGWLKQLAGAVDNAMTRESSGLNPEHLQQFRRANSLYTQMKDLFDNPQSTLYSVVRAPDGLQAANTLAQIKPSVGAYIGKNLPELMPLLQRQTMERMLSPAGNAVPEWGTLATRFSRTQKEALRGILTPEQVKLLDDAARTARHINADSNVSGSGKVIQARQETKDFFSKDKGLGAALALAGTGHVLEAGVAAASPFVNNFVKRQVAKALTNPERVARVMRGPEGWAARGVANLQAAGVDQATIDGLKATRYGKQVLMNAGDVQAGSKAMRAILARIAAGQVVRPARSARPAAQ